MGKTILIGNGLNRCYSNDVSTENIIFSLEKELLKKESELIKLNNFSLVFESIINGKYNFDIKEYFNFICDKLKILNKINNDIYMLNKDLLLSFDSIVTTNYDYSIEYNLFGDSNIKTQAVGRNKGYVYTSNENNKKIYHIHGDLNHKKIFVLDFMDIKNMLNRVIQI